MGRRENAVAASTRQMEALALWLRAQRQREALTYAAMAQRINYGFTASMLSRAAGGKTVPTRQLVEAFARGCQADPVEARRLWKAARAAEHPQAAGRRVRRPGRQSRSGLLPPQGHRDRGGTASRDGPSQSARWPALSRRTAAAGRPGTGRQIPAAQEQPRCRPAR
ncbi:helix-turn-helix domain-containing protein [Streptomyces goshikiensis]